RDAVPGEEILGEGLAALQPGRRGGGAEDAVSARSEGIHHARHQRRFRADHGHRDAFLLGQGQETLDIGGGDADVAAPRFARGAGIARRDQDLAGPRRLRQFPRQRVLASPRTDHQNLHPSSPWERALRAIAQCLKCRTPVNTIAIPCSSAASITSASRIEPPGWITARIPAAAAASMPSRKGKKASEAITEPGTSSPASSALSAAIFAETTRLICPAPTPMVRPSFA